jgi:hypothetical protein
MAIDDTNIIAAMRAASPNRTFNKASIAAEGAGTFHSLWKVAGFPPAGANPPLFSAGAGYVPTKGTLGAFPFVNAVDPIENALCKFAQSGVTAGTLFIYDRLWACSGFGTVATTAQNIVTPGTLPAGRDPNNGEDVEPWLEVYTAPGATTATWTVTGTDSAGNAGRSWGYTHPANAESVGQMVPLMPGGVGTAAARSTMRVPASFQASVSSGTAGDVGLTLMRRLGMAAVTSANLGQVIDALATGLPEVYNDACLALMVQCSTTNTGFMLGEIVVGKPE